MSFAGKKAHIVAADECMSCIAEYRIGFPVYGENGSLKLLQSLNPHLKDKKNIELGDVIIFPTDLETSHFIKSIDDKPSGFCLAQTKGKYFIGGEGRVREVASQASEKNKAIDFEHSERVSKKTEIALKSRSGRSLGVYHNVIEAKTLDTGHLAEWVSQENIFFKGFYQYAQGQWWLGVSGAYHIQKYEAELSPSFTWNESGPRLLKLSLLADYEKSRWSAGLSLDYNQEVFIFEENQEISLREVFILGVSLRAKYKWLDSKRWASSLGFELNAPLKGSDSLKPKGSLGHYAFIDLRRDRAFGLYDFSTKIFYGMKSFTNNQNMQEEKFAGLEFEFTWPEGV